MRKSIAQTRIEAGQCPQCGKEAAPYRLCYDCRQVGRIGRALRRGEGLGVFRRAFGNVWILGDKVNDQAANARMKKWSTSIIPDENDKRFRPRLRGAAIDVEATLVKIIERIGRPCTIEEISMAWGKLRARRSDPLDADLSRIIVAADRRAAKNMRRARSAHK